MEILNRNTAPAIPIDLEAHLLYKGVQTEVIILDLLPGEQLKKHDNPIPVIFFIINGYGEIEISESKYEVSKGDCFKVMPGNPREWHNTGKSTLSLLVIKELTAK